MITLNLVQTENLQTTPGPPPTTPPPLSSGYAYLPVHSRGGGDKLPEKLGRDVRPAS